MQVQPTIKILAKVNQNSSKNKEEVFTRLFRYLLRPDIYYVAYKNLYANNGAGTKGIDDDTADGFSESKINAIIESLSNNTYCPKPVRRTYIAKANGQLRPLGIPTFTDKLVQEVLRMILEAVYEPVFSNYSHGFRPNKSCHTALKDIKYGFNGTKWFIEGDIKGCFDNINHMTLIEIINAKIKDARLIQLVIKFLKAGYLENWKYNATHSGTPQGGIVSPILANIYLNELDKFVEKLKANFDNSPKELRNPEYKKQAGKLERIREKIAKTENTEQREELLDLLKAEKAILLKMPARANTDKKIKYVRYADDFIIGINGSKDDCQSIKSELKKFIGETLKMELSEEKTLITHSNEYARFLGYDIRVRRSNEVKQKVTKNGKTLCRTLSNTVELLVPLKDKIEKFLFNTQTVERKDGEMFPVKRNKIVRLTDLEILATYNAELRGICNYYSMASNFDTLFYFAYLMEYSCLKTIASKHKSSISKIKALYKDQTGSWGIPYETKKGAKRLYFADYKKCARLFSDIISLEPLMHRCNGTTFEDRLKEKVCALCGDETATHYEIHHVNKLKNLKGKAHWERIMIAKQRKTLVLCQDCHQRIHKEEFKKT